MNKLRLTYNNNYNSVYNKKIESLTFLGKADNLNYRMLKENSGVYLIVDTKNKGYYWGCSEDLKSRLVEHFRVNTDSWRLYEKRKITKRFEVPEEYLLRDIEVYVFNISLGVKGVRGGDLKYWEYQGSLYALRDLGSYTCYNVQAPFSVICGLDVDTLESDVYWTYKRVEEGLNLTRREIYSALEGKIGPRLDNNQVLYRPYHGARHTMWRIFCLIQRDGSKRYYTKIKDIADSHGMAMSMIYRSVNENIWVWKKQVLVKKSVLIVCCGLAIRID